jgi:glutamate-1-semialdehyde 2,1-aminomutase
MAAGKAMLDALTPAVYAKLEKTSDKLERGMKAVAKELGFADRVTINRVGSILTPFFGPPPLDNFDDVKRTDLDAFKRFFHAMRRRGIFMAPAPFEAMFVSTAHGEDHVKKTLEAFRESLREAFPG